MIDPIAASDLSADSSWRALSDRLRSFVGRRVAERADVDDLVQEILLRVQRGLPRLRDTQRFGPWVYQVARNALSDHRRAAVRHTSAMREAAEDPRSNEWSNADPTESDFLQHAMAEYAASLIDGLPHSYREAMKLTEVEGLTQAQAAARVGVSLSGMKSRVQRGRRMLRAAVHRDCEVVLDGRSRVIECVPRPHRRSGCWCDEESKTESAD